MRQVLAVPSSSANIEMPDELTPGSGRRQEQRENLREYSDALKAEIGGGEVSFARASQFLRNRPGYLDTAAAYRLPRAGRDVAFMRLFGFQIQGAGPSMTVRNPRAAPAAPAVPAAPAAPAPRAPRGPDIIPRGTPSRLPAGQPLAFGENPFRANTAAHTRYEAYRSATNVGEARARGATPLDLMRAINRGAARLG